MLLEIEWWNFNSGSDKFKIFIAKVPFTLHPLVGILHNSITAKREKILALLKPPKKASKIVLSLPKWNKWEKGRWFLVFAHQEQGKDISVVVWPFSWLIIKLWMKILPTCGLSPCAAFKTRSCSGFDLWIVPAWKLKKQAGVSDWTCGLSLCGAFKTKRCSVFGLWIVLVGMILLDSVSVLKG